MYFSSDFNLSKKESSICIALCGYKNRQLIICCHRVRFSLTQKSTDNIILRMRVIFVLTAPCASMIKGARGAAATVIKTAEMNKVTLHSTLGQCNREMSSNPPVLLTDNPSANSRQINGGPISILRSSSGNEAQLLHLSNVKIVSCRRKRKRCRLRFRFALSTPTPHWILLQ